MTVTAREKPSNSRIRASATSRIRTLTHGTGRLLGWPVLAVAMLLAAALMGGGSRSDIGSLLIFRPLSIGLFVIATWRYGAAVRQQRTILFWFAFFLMAIAVGHVIPLPPAVWTAMPLREFVTDSYHDLGVGLPWLPLTLSPAAGWNALFALAAPMAMFFAAGTLQLGGFRRLAWFILALIGLSGILGLLQVAGPPNGPLYFFRVTNAGAAVGIFANRNHNGLFLAMALPILALFWHVDSEKSATQLRLRRTLVAGCAVTVLPMILLTGSRGALLALFISAAGAVWIVWQGHSRSAARAMPASRRGVTERRWAQFVIGGATALCGLLLIVLMVARSSSLQRALETDPNQEVRLKALPTIWKATFDAFPWGYGAGSFEGVYQHFEPASLLGPQYLNHAHNDWIEVVFDYGLLGGAALLLGGILYCGAVIRLIRARSGSEEQFGYARAGATIIAMTAAFSVFDYPARVPLIADVVVVAAIWLASGVSAKRSPSSK